MKQFAFFMTLLMTLTSFAATPAELIAQAEANVKIIGDLGHNVGMTQDDSQGLLSALGQNHFAAEDSLKEMRSLEKTENAQSRLETLAAEVKALAVESQELAR